MTIYKFEIEKTVEDVQNLLERHWRRGFINETRYDLILEKFSAEKEKPVKEGQKYIMFGV